MTNNYTLNLELAATLERAAAHARRCKPLSLWDVKAFLLAALDDNDRALEYGNPGAGIDALLGTKEHAHG